MRILKLNVFSYRAVVVVALLIGPALAQAQSERTNEPLKQGGPRRRPVCAAAKPAVATTAEQRQRARDLVERAQQAAIRGDTPAALVALLDAAVLDPANADLAYQLGRAYETAKDSRNAVVEYCRFLSLAPAATEAKEVVERVRTLAPQTEDVIDLGLAIFRSGVTAYERGQFVSADSAFTQAIASDADWADAYYNRARARQAVGDLEGARADLAQYLRLAPEASDRVRVSRQITTLGPPVLSPLAAFVIGIVVPGGGEFYAHRPIRGALSLVTVGAAYGVAAGTKTTTSGASVRTTRPYLIPGVTAGVVITVAAAADAAWFAYASQDDAPRVGLSFVPTREALVASLHLRW